MGDTASQWMLMLDGVVFTTYNHQGGPRGGDQFISTNWLMGMAARNAGPGRLTLTGMVSLEPATVGACGYRLLFQVGETCDGMLIVDRQHPHDLLMQASAAWRIPLSSSTGLTLAGAPVGEPALGPTAFMHRPSAAENPAAPLAHHWLDSTHIAMGVLTAAVDHRPWTVEASLFQGAEPDDNRWDLMDPGPLDSWSGRLWFEPSASWSVQVSHAFLNDPEASEPGDVRRTTASLSWWRVGTAGFTAATVAFGLNDADDGRRGALLAEATHRRGRYAAYGRFETLQMELAPFLEPMHQGHVEPHTDPLGLPDMLTALTLGATRELASWRRFEIAAGGDLTLNWPPAPLEVTHGAHPVSFHVFLRIRPPVGHMGRMWNMRMGKP
jgi:hypothetical protein